MQGLQRWVAAIGVLAVAAGCSDSETGPTPSIALALSGATISIEQDASGTVTATLSRGGDYDGAVTLSVTGAPTGVTATPNPSSLSGTTTTSTITLDVGVSTTPGAYPLTVQASGSGVDAATANLTLTVTELPAGMFTISVAPTTLSVAQGASGTANVTLARTNFTDEVTFSAANLPAGVTATFDPVSTTGTASVATIAVAGTTAPGSYTLNLSGTAGTDVQSVDLALSVPEPTTGTQVSWTFCESTGLPVWVAYQDGAGPWIHVPALDNTYEFSLSSGTGGIAAVTESGGSTDLTVYYGITDELVALGSDQCEGTGDLKTLNGSVAGLGATDQATISMGGATASVIGAAGTDYSLEGVLDGMRDLFASRIITTVDGEDVSFDIDKFILRRDVDLADGSTIPLLDFEAAEAFDPAMNTVTVNNAGTDLTAVTTGYFTDNGAAAAFFAGVPNAGTSLMYAGVPVAQQEANDLHLLSVIAVPDAEDPTDSRSVQEMFNAATDRTLTLGPALGILDVMSIAGAPYPRLEIEYMPQAEYGRFWIASFDQPDRSVQVAATEEYVDNGTVGLAIPDFTGTDGWDPNWAPAAGVATDWFFLGLGWDATGGIITAPFQEGGLFYTASRRGSITP